MARNRQIKVEFWADEKIGSCSPIAQLLFIGSWTFADDSGVCRANTVYLRSNIFPYGSITNQQIEKALIELAEKKIIFLADYNNEKFMLIKNFLKHQQIKKPSSLRLITSDYKEIFKEYPTSTPLVPHQFPPNVNVNVNVNVNEKVNVYGEFKNVKLSEKEFTKLSEIWGNKLNDGIEILSSYLKAKGDTYKNHYAVMGKHNWVFERVHKNIKPQGEDDKWQLMN